MKEKIAIIIGITIFFSHKNVTLSQTREKPKAVITPQSPALNSPQNVGNERLDNLEKRLTKLEVLESANSNTTGSIAVLIGGLGNALSIAAIALVGITATPIFIAAFSIAFREVVIREISRKVEEHIGANIKASEDKIEKLKAEHAHAEEQIKYLSESFKKFESDFALSRSILSNVRNYLKGFEDQEVDKLENAVEEASEFLQDLVFYEARDFLIISYKEGRFKDVQRTVPLFRAIISSDGKEEEYFRNRAYLAYALSCKEEQPELGKSIYLLEEAHAYTKKALEQEDDSPDLMMLITQTQLEARIALVNVLVIFVQMMQKRIKMVGKNL